MDFSVLHRIQTDCWGYPASYTMGKWENWSYFHLCDLVLKQMDLTFSWKRKCPIILHIFVIPFLVLDFTVYYRKTPIAHGFLYVGLTGSLSGLDRISLFY
jgi:hypothetical protein